MSAKFGFLNRKQNVSITTNSLDELIRNYLARKRIENRSPKTIRTYEQTLRALERYIVDNEIISIDNTVLEKYIEYLAFKKEKWDDHPTSKKGSRGLSPRGVNNIIRNLRAFFNYLVSERIITDSPLINIKLQKETNDTFEVFTDEEVLRLLDVPNRKIYTGRRDYVMMLTLLDTGCRIGEMTSLRLRDIDFRLRQIVIPGEVTKTKTTRVIPISERLAKELKLLTEYMSIEDGAEYIWLTQFGERYFADTFAKMLKKYGKKAGITSARVSPHTFRNYFAIKYLRNKGDTFSLMRILGHTDVAMTNRYVKYTSSDLSEAHESASPLMNLLDKGNDKKRGRVLFK